MSVQSLVQYFILTVSNCRSELNKFSKTYLLFIYK